jgi:N-methylhydantoinase A
MPDEIVPPISGRSGRVTGGRLVGVDVGGTFTDVVALDDGEVLVAKVPTDLQSSDRSVLQGAEAVQVDLAEVFNLASTAGLNAVITRQTPKVAFLTTLGHRDMLDRGRNWRPYEYLTDASWRRGFGDASRPLVPRYLRRGIHERIAADGTELIPLDEDQARQELEVVRKCGVAGVAICLLNSYRNPSHEARLKELVLEVLGVDVAVSVSNEVSPVAREYPRASTTVIDLLMKLKYSDYTARLQSGLTELGFKGVLNYADCSARLMPVDYAMERPYRLVMGGPAAGAVASAHFGSISEMSKLICADVGGTSCDISLVIEGQPWSNNTYELEWDLVVNALSTEIVTLGAGGGSIISVGPTGELRVGPGSAGAHPGPAAYAEGGHNPTVTDAALLSGILSSDRFLGGKMKLREDLALSAFEGLDTPLDLGDRVRFAWMIGLNNIAEGIIDIAVRRGIDPRDFSLMAFGAAGPMMLPCLLDSLPFQSVIVPPNPGGFSALGMLSSDQVFADNRTWYGVLEPGLAPTLSELFVDMERSLLERVGADASGVRTVRTFDARLLGQGWETPLVAVPAGPLGEEQIGQMIENFHREYAIRNGERFEAFPVEGVTYRVELVVPSAKVVYRELPSRKADASLSVEGRQAIRYLYGDAVEAQGYSREKLLAGDKLRGPVIVWEPNSTTFVPPDRLATIGRHGEIVIK